MTLRGLAVLAGLAVSPALAATPALYGVNISGAELNPTSPGRINTDYVYPSSDEIAWMAAEKMSALRLPVLWQRLQPTLGAGLDAAELGRLRATIATARVHGLQIIIDVHNFGFYRADAIGSRAVPASAFAAFWALMAAQFANADGVAFDLMNEPHSIAAAPWAGYAAAALQAIRATGARNLVLVPGSYWDGAHDFVDGGGDGGSNATAFADLTDPAANMAIEVHQYLDSNFSGTSPDCIASDAAVATLADVTAWAREHRRRLFLGEFGGGPGAQCQRSLAAMLSYLRANADVWIGWTYWAAGAWWSADYPLSVEPAQGRARPQTAVLEHAIASLRGAE